MLVRIVAEIITEVSVFPEDVVNADTVGDYKAELDCNVGNAALDYLAQHLSGSDDIRIVSVEPFDTGVEEYGNILNVWQKEYNKRMEKYEKTLE